MFLVESSERSQSWQLKNKIFSFKMAGSIYFTRMHSDLEKLVSRDKIDKDTGEKLSLMPPGSFCLHSSWGAGKVTEFDRLNLKVIVDFEDKPAHSLGMKFAAKSLVPVAENSFIARRHSHLDELKALSKEDPVALVKSILEENKDRLMLDDLETLLKGRVIAEGKYKGWWDGTKKKLREDRQFVVPSKRTEPLELRKEGTDPCRALIDEYEQSRDLKAKVKAVENLIKDVNLFEDGASKLKSVAETIGEDGRKGVKLNFVPAVELILARDELISKVKDLTAEDHWVQMHQILEAQEDEKIAELLENVSLHKARLILKGFPLAFGGDQWVGRMLGIIKHTNLRTITEIANHIIGEEQSDAVIDYFENGLNQRVLTSDALAWICKERGRYSEVIFDPSLSLSVMSSLETDQLKEEGAVRAANRLRDLVCDDRDLISDLIKDADINTIRNFASRLVSSASFDELTRKSLMARVLKLRPEVQDLVAGREVEEEVMFVSEDSLQSRKAAYEKLIREEIPQNREDIKIARSYGDLRENFEYKSAKEYQRILMKRKADWERDLRLATPIDFSSPDTSSVGIGTTVVLTPENGGESLIYSILGAWDSDPDKGIIAYLSERGNILLNKKVGDDVALPDPNGGNLHFTIKSIEVCKREDTKADVKESEYLRLTRQYDPNVDASVVAKIEKYLGPSLLSRDARYIAATDERELETVVNGFMKNKLDIEDKIVAMEKVKAVCEMMKETRMKNRVTFYYLLAQNEGKLDEF